MSFSSFFSSIQTKLFPAIEHHLGALSEKQKLLIEIVEMCNISKHAYFLNNTFGRPCNSKVSLAIAFVAKAVYHLQTTKSLVELLQSDYKLSQLCGFKSPGQVPSESTFSRAFADFAKAGLMQKIHEEMIKSNYGDKLAGHVSRDSTPISAREKPLRKPVGKNKSKHKRGRPKKGEVREKKQNKLMIQKGRSLKENLADIPQACDYGNKLDSKGYKKSWHGYKLHVDTIDGDIPIAAVISSASTHDNQVSIPLTQMSSERVDYCYELMDAAYDAAQIREFTESMNHIPIIDFNKRRKEKKQFTPAQKQRYNQRSSAERVMGQLKDNYGGTTVRVKGAAKVMTHLMSGIIVITAQQLIRMI